MANLNSKDWMDLVNKAAGTTDKAKKAKEKKKQAEQKKQQNIVGNFRAADQQTIKEASKIDKVRPGLSPDAPGFVNFMYDATTPIRNLMSGNAGRIAEKTADTLLMTDRSNFGVPYTPASSPTAQKVTDVGGAILGSLAPYSGIYRGLNAAETMFPAVQRFSPLARTGVKGGIAGGTYETAVGIGHEESPQEIAQRMALGAGLGAFGDVALMHGLPALRQFNQTQTPRINNMDLSPAWMKVQPTQQPFRAGGNRSGMLMEPQTLDPAPIMPTLPRQQINPQQARQGLYEGMGVRPLNNAEILPESQQPLRQITGSYQHTVKRPLGYGRSNMLMEPETVGPQPQMPRPEPTLPTLNMAERMTPNTISSGNIPMQRMPQQQVRQQPPQNATGTVRDNINREPAKRRSFKEVFNSLRTQFIDDLAPLENVEKQIRGKVSSAEDSLYKQGRLSRGAPEKASEIIRTRLSPVISDIEKKGYTYQDLGDYALAVHAKDVNASGLNSGFSNEQIENTIRQLGAPEIEAARQELTKLSDELLNELVDAGTVSREAAQAMRKKWPNYMPLFRHFDDDKVEFSSGISKSLANVADPIQKLAGSNREVVDPIENMIKNVFKTVSATERNKVALQLGRLADEDTTGLIRRLPKGEEVGRKNVVYARENGQRVGYEVHPELYKAMLQLDKESSTMLTRLLQKPASVLRAGATLTPEFSFRNPMRDIVQAYAVSNSGFNPFVDFPMALLDVMSKGKIPQKFGWKTYYSQWLKDGGGYGNIISMDRKMHQEAMKRIIKQPPTERFKNVVTGKSLIELLRKIADISESATKVGEYRAALKKGVSRQEAAYRSRDIMDFARAGVSVREANKIVAFLNANIQGKSKIIRAIQENPTGVTIRAAKMITLPTVGVFLAQKYLANNEQKQRIKDAPSWLKNSFWLVPVPGTNQIARIPKPFDLAPIFANAPERFLDYVYNKNPKAFDDFAKESLASAAIPTMITGLAPIVEGMANYSFFRQAPIIPQRESNDDYPDQYDVYTTETAKAIGKGINKITSGEGAFKNFGSPRIVDNTIRGMTAGLGQYATGAIDLMLDGLDAVDKPERPDKKFSEKPLARAFLVNENMTGASMDKLYSEKDRLTRARNSAQNRGQEFKQEERYKQINNTTKEIGNISKQIRIIENDPKLDGATKRKRIDVLNKQRINLARQAAEYFKL